MPLHVVRFVAVLALPLLLALLAAEAPQARQVPRIGLLQAVQNENTTAFVQALRDFGYVDGQHVLIETHMYGARLEQLSHLAHQRVTLPCAVMVAAAPYAIRAALRATSTILLIGLDLLYASNDTTRARRALVLEAGT